MSQSSNDKFDPEKVEPHKENSLPERPPKQRGASLFGPIIIIAVGIYFLLYNFGYAGELNWYAALQLWPLLLIFIGINIIVRHAPHPWGSLLSALVGLVAVGIFGYVLLFGSETMLPESLRIHLPPQATVQRQDVVIAGDGVETAVVNIDFGAPHATLNALQTSNDLMRGTVTYLDDIILDTSQQGNQAEVELRTHDTSVWFWVDPRNWNNFGQEDQWQLGLNPQIETDLTLDAGSGAVNLELVELDLSNLSLDGGSGSVQLTLPGGDYDVVYAAGSGATKMWLPSSGRHTIDIDGASGSILLYLPADMEAQVNLDGGSGSFHLDENRFKLVSGDADAGVWETAVYDNADDRVDLIIDAGSGSVRIEEPGK